MVQNAGFGIKDFVCFSQWRLQKCSATIQIIQFVILLAMPVTVTQDLLLSMDSFVVFGGTDQPATAHFHGACRLFATALQFPSARAVCLSVLSVCAVFPSLW